MQDIQFLPFQSWDIVSMLCQNDSLDSGANVYLVRPSWYDRDGSVYDKSNAPKWLQDYMLSEELKWHTN